MIDCDSILDELVKYRDELTIVEGLRDRIALEQLGFSNIVQLHSGNSLLEVVEAIKEADKAVILTDLDREGKGLRRRLLQYFSLYGLNEIRRPRELLAQLRVKHVENLQALNDLAGLL